MTISSDAVALAWMDAVRDDLLVVTEKIQAVSVLGDDGLDSAINMIVTAGGKRMRPAITLLVSRACDAPYDKTISVAASVELLHTATLVHDDLVDNAPERRGVDTLHMQMPLGVTVLTGDFLFAQAAALAAEAESVRVVQTFSQTLVSICKGEILQAQTRWTVSDMEAYKQRIYGKTAALFEAAAISAAMLGDVTEDDIQAYASFGRHLGMAFQIVDDALDFVADGQKLGKPVGHDLRQGYVTLPAMLYLKEVGMSAEEFLIQIRDEQGIEEVIDAVRSQDLAHAAVEIAREHIDAAQGVLHQMRWGPATEALMDITRYVVARDF